MFDLTTPRTVFVLTSLQLLEEVRGPSKRQGESKSDSFFPIYSETTQESATGA